MNICEESLIFGQLYPTVNIGVHLRAPDIIGGDTLEVGWGMARITSVPRTGNKPPGRLAAGARNVADVHGAPVEAASAETGIAFDNAAFPYQNNGNRPGDGGGRRQRENGGVYIPPQKTFAAMFELQQTTERRSGGPRSRTRVFAELRAKAINTYLTNSSVIHGKKDVPGDSVSLKL